MDTGTGIWQFLMLKILNDCIVFPDQRIYMSVFI